MTKGKQADEASAIQVKSQSQEQLPPLPLLFFPAFSFQSYPDHTICWREVPTSAQSLESMRTSRFTDAISASPTFKANATYKPEAAADDHTA